MTLFITTAALIGGVASCIACCIFITAWYLRRTTWEAIYGLVLFGIGCSLLVLVVIRLSCPEVDMTMWK